MRRPARPAVVLLVLLLPFLCVVGACAAWPRYRLYRANRWWARESEPIDALLARHPRTAKNEAAQRLEEMCHGLDISLGPKGNKRPADPRFPVLGSWVGEQTMKEAEGLEPPPTEAASYLSDHGPRIRAIVDHVVHAGEIVWDSDLAAGLADPIPPLTGHRALQSVLLAQALESARSGDGQASRDALTASWRVSETLEGRPGVTTQLTLVIVSQLQHGAIRVLPDPPQAWSERFGKHCRQRAVRALQLEAFWLERHCQGKGLQELLDAEEGRPPKEDWESWWFRMVSRPYVEFMPVDYNPRLRAAAEEVVALDPCRLEDAIVDERIKGSVPRWNFLGRLAMPSVAGFWAALGRAGYAAELTGLVLEAKARRAQGAPLALAARQSQVCPSVRWTATLDAGGLTIAPEADPFPASAPQTSPRRFRVASQPPR